MKRVFYRLVGGAIVAALGIIATSLELTPRILLSILVGLPSLVLLILSRKQLGNSFAVMPEAKRLVTTGLYSRIQHPLYLFLDLFLAGVIVGFGRPSLFIPWAVVVLVQMVQSRREEKILAAAFGPDYEAYRNSTLL